MTIQLRINMSSLKFRFEKIDETRNYLLEEIKHNYLMIEKCKETSKYLNMLNTCFFHFQQLLVAFQFLHLLH